MQRRLLLAGLALALTACAEKPAPVSIPEKESLALINQHNLLSHLEYLASDELAGREPGTPGYALAAQYVADQYADIGLAPGNQDSFFHQVDLQTYQADPDSVALVLHRDGGDVTLQHREDFVTYGDKVRSEDEVRAEVVYIGYGVHAPELGYSDLDGVDIDGKIVAMFRGGPQLIKGDKLAHYSSSRTKSRELAARGAVGVIVFSSRKTARTFPWDRARKVLAAKPSMTWVSATGEADNYYPEIRGTAWVSPDVAQTMFAGTPMTFEDALDAIEASEVRTMPLGIEATLKRKSRHERIQSPNVVGLLRGSDPDLADEYIVYTAHLDHTGRTTAPIDGDDINNGMYDNAMGTAIMIEAARALAANPPRRSILFVALTSEERGLLGSDFFAHYPPVPIDSIVANVNMDMPLFLFPSDSMVAFGAEHSSLGAVAAAATEAEGFELVPDQQPEEILFSRSDQFSFVRQGIPAIWLSSSTESSDPAVDGPAVTLEHRTKHYHKPSDDLTRPIVWEDALAFTRTNARIGWGVGNADARPTWNEDSFYGKLYAPRD